MRYDEDTLVQATTADYLRSQLQWESVYAYNTETFGSEGTLGRKDETEVVLTRYLGLALMKLNPGLPQEAYQAAIREITQPTVSQSLLLCNRDKYNLVRDGVLVPYRDEKGTSKKARLRVFALGEGRSIPTPHRHYRLRKRTAASLYGAEEHSSRSAPRVRRESL
jgi:type I restriction enzyme R subunit